MGLGERESDAPRKTLPKMDPAPTGIRRGEDMSLHTPPPPDALARYDQIFAQLKDSPDAFSGACAKDKWAAFGLSGEALLKVWALADQQKRGKLNINEHRIAMHLIHLARAGVEVPASVPPALLQAAMGQPDPAAAPVAPAPVAAPAPAAPPPAAPPPAAPPAAPATPGPWTLTDADVALYKNMFAAADGGKDGKVRAAGSQLKSSGLIATDCH